MAERNVRWGGRLVHVLIEPGDGPPVILLGGCGMPSYAWDPVVELLTGRPTVRLDRPGLGGTPWPAELPTLAAESDTLIDLAEEHPGGVLVAHSMAAFHAEAIIRRRPDLVAGLVLVDGSVEAVPRTPVGEAAWLALARGAARGARFPAVAALGPIVDRLTVSAQSGRRVIDPMDARSAVTYAQPDAMASVIAEFGSYRRQAQDLTRLRVAYGWPDGLPVEVLTAGVPGGETQLAAQGWLSELLGGHQTVLPRSRHLVMLDDPQAVADAVERVLDG